MIPHWRILRRLYPSMSESARGVGLIEVLIGLVLIVVASLATLSYYSYALGGVGKQENRRAALEIARQRLERLMEANIDCVAGTDSSDATLYWLTTAGAIPPCTWGRTPNAGSPVWESVAINKLPSGPRMQTTVQRISDPSAGTITLDTVELSIKVWFTPNTGMDDNFNRVHLRTLRT